MARFASSVSKRACPRSHQPSLNPKYLQRRKSVSAVIARRPDTISLIRPGGTPISLASRYLVMPSGFKNSSCSISPGEIGSIRFNFVSLDSGSPRFQHHKHRRQPTENTIATDRLFGCCIDLVCYLSRFLADCLAGFSNRQSVQTTRVVQVFSMLVVQMKPNPLRSNQRKAFGF